MRLDHLLSMEKRPKEAEIQGQDNGEERALFNFEGPEKGNLKEDNTGV